MRTPVVRWLLLLVLTAMPMVAMGADGAATGASLSSRQTEWLGRHPTIILGIYDSGWPPFESVHDGRPQGLGYDYLSLLAQRLGVRVDVRKYRSWGEVLDAACRGEVDVVMNIILTADRTRCLVYTRAYVDAPLAVVGRPDDTRTSNDPDLHGLRVVTERDFVTSDQVRARFPAALQVTAADTLTALNMIGRNEADVYIGNAYVADVLIDQHAMRQVMLLRPSDLPPQRLHFGIPTRGGTPACYSRAKTSLMMPISETTHTRLRTYGTPAAYSGR